MAELLLIARLAGRRVAFPAAEVEAVVELEGMSPAPRAAPHVAGLSALRSRVLTVIDGLAALEAGRTEGPAQDAIVVVLVAELGRGLNENHDASYRHARKAFTASIARRVRPALRNAPK